MGTTWRRARGLVGAALVASAATLASAAPGAGLSPVTSAPAPSAAAAACTLTPTAGTQLITITTPTGPRKYRLHVPAGIPGPNAMLLVSLHGLGFNGEAQENASGLSTFADQAKFIVAYPNGLAGSWAITRQASNDIAFIRQVVAHISSTYCVDPDRVHADGISMGGTMSQRLACQASDLFASVTSLASADPAAPYLGPSQPCSLPRPTSVYMSCGTADPTYGGSCVPARDAWASRLACPAPVVSTPPFGSQSLYSPCNAGSQLVWRTWTGLGHAFPTGAARTQWHNEMLWFLVTHPMP
jgi:polyhydroxybutyrate depolymerase